MSWWLVWFGRDGSARYVSHLDTARALQRSFARAGLTVARSAGMRPKPRLSLGLPLPVGAAVDKELAVVQLEESPVAEEVLARLQNATPEGLRVVAVQPVEGRPRPVAVAAEYECFLPDGEPAAVAQALDWFVRQPRVLFERLSPKGRKVIDLKHYVGEAKAVPAAGGVRLTFIIRHKRGGAARPEEFVRLVAERAGLEPVLRGLRRRRVTYKGLAPLLDAARPKRMGR